MNQSEIVRQCGFTDKEAAVFACRREMESRKYPSFSDKARAVFNLYASELPAFIGLCAFVLVLLIGAVIIA